jgi:phosphatidylinositol alpha-1,6-mannosyltransferase
MLGQIADILGLFPAFDSPVFGGVQASGREAWQGIVARTGQERARAIFYQPGSSKIKAVLRIVRNRQEARVILVWHLHLLKLLPFLNSPASRVILFLHGVEAWRKHDPLTRFLLKKVDLFLSNSDYTWQRFLDYNPAFRAADHRTVHLGAGSPLGGTPPPPSQPPAALMIGRVSMNENYKGHLQVIKAWQRLRQSVPCAQLWIVGDGDLRALLEQNARENDLDGCIKFFGSVPDSKKEELIASSRCLLLPSRGEGFGLVYLEAMRMGRPCLVSTADAGREVVNPPEAGLAVDPALPDDIAAAVQRLLNCGSVWNEWSVRARTRYEARFTGEHFRVRLVNVIFETEPALRDDCC